MDDEKIKSLWTQLQHTEGPIPWPVLDRFADLTVENPSIWKSLAGRYNEIALSWEDYSGYEHLYIPAIFAKAAPKLSKETIAEICPFLVEKLCEAGYDDDDILLEVYSAACGSMGPDILPVVLDFILKEDDTYGAWAFLWGLLNLAQQADEAVRNQVIEFCVDFLEQADRGQISLSDTDLAAEILVHLGCTEYIGLLKSLEKKSRKTIYHAEYRESVRILSGKQAPYDLTEMWEEPLEKWLPSRWKWYKDWYDEDTSAEIEEQDEFDSRQYKADKLVWRFLRSADAAELSSGYIEDAAFIIGRLLEYAWVYESTSVEKLNESVLKGVLLRTFAQKVAADEDLFAKVAPVTASFLAWLEKQGILPSGLKLASKVQSWSKQIVGEGMDPSNWSMGKSFTMQASADGVDVTDNKEMQRYIAQYNLKKLQERTIAESFENESSDYEPPVPISEVPARVGRNQPCPCGSGRKYKKCCGSLNNAGRDFR